MKATHTLTTAAFMSIGLIIAIPASALPHYTALELGLNYDSGWTEAGATLNANGQVAGMNGPQAFVSGPNGIGITDLGFLPGAGGPYASGSLGINASGQVVGISTRWYSETYEDRAFVTGPNGVGMTDIGTLPGYTDSFASAINDSGRIVGSSTRNNNESHAFITDANGVNMTDLGTLPGFTNSYATDIDANGRVTGYFVTPANTQHAFLTGPNGEGMADLGVLQGYTSSQAYAINDTGRVVGGSSAGNAITHAFLTGPNGIGMTDLGTLLGYSHSSASGINASGQVVGTSETIDHVRRHAFVTGTNGEDMTDLNTLVSLANGDYFTEAHDINDRGQIVAKTFNGHHTYLLSPITTPVAVPAAVWLFASALGGLGLVGGRTGRRCGEVRTASTN